MELDMELEKQKGVRLIKNIKNKKKLKGTTKIKWPKSVEF